MSPIGKLPFHVDFKQDVCIAKNDNLHYICIYSFSRNFDLIQFMRQNSHALLQYLKSKP